MKNKLSEIKIESFPMMSGEIGLQPKDRPIWLYKALDTKTNRYLQVIVDTTNKPDEKTEEKIYTHIAYAFQRAERTTNETNTILRRKQNEKNN